MLLGALKNLKLIIFIQRNLISGKTIFLKSDLKSRSLGVTFFEIFSDGKLPESIISDDTLPKNKSGIVEIDTIIKKCRDPDPKLRPSLKEIGDILKKLKFQFCK